MLGVVGTGFALSSMATPIVKLLGPSNHAYGQRQSLTRFRPEIHGFHFRNNFSNLRAAGIVSKGRCGGMAFAALDYYNRNIPIPPHITSDFGGEGVPPGDDPYSGHWLSNYIFQRLGDSLLPPIAVLGPLEWSARKFIDWSVLPDFATVFFKGVIRATWEDEVPRIRQSIDNGRPVVIGLLISRDLTPSVLGQNHQVVAYGYRGDEIYVYDNNYPDEEVILTGGHRSYERSESEWDPTTQRFVHRRVWQNAFYESRGNNNISDWWRGFFVQNYNASSPPNEIRWGWTWEDLSSPRTGIIGSPAAVSREPGNLVIFIRDRGGSLYTRWIDQGGNGWSAWDPVPMTVSDNRSIRLGSDPAAISWNVGRIDLFALGRPATLPARGANLLNHSFTDSGPWGNWESFAAPEGFSFSSAPAVSSWGPGRLDVFIICNGPGSNGHLFYKRYSQGWSDSNTPGFDSRGWRDMGSPSSGFTSDKPQAVFTTPPFIELFGRGQDGQVYHRLFYPHDFRSESWVSLGSPPGGIVGAPALIAQFGNPAVEIIVRNNTNTLWSNSRTRPAASPPPNWSSWRPKDSTPLASDPWGVSRRNNRMDIFVVVRSRPSTVSRLHFSPL